MTKIVLNNRDAFPPGFAAHRPDVRRPVSLMNDERGSDQSAGRAGPDVVW